MTPIAVPKFVRNDDAVFTFDRPSAPQKRPWANGRSADTHHTSVFGNVLTNSLNLRVLVAHVGVSIEGKMLRITRLPRNSFGPISDSVPVVIENAGAFAPTLGN